MAMISVIRRNSSRIRNQQFAHFPQPGRLLSLWPMFRFLRLWLGSLPRCLHSRRSLLLENLALRQQLSVLKRRHSKPRLSPLDKLFWVLALRFWSAWKQTLMVVTPETVVGWHRAAFRLYQEFDLQGQTASRKEEVV